MQRIKRPATKIPSASASAAACRSSKSVNNNEISCSASSTVTVRKPLSDLTNFNLIPTDTLRKLVSSSSVSNSETQSLLRKPQAPIFPISQNPLISGPQKPDDNSKSDTRSGTSVGSSNFANDPKTIPQNPTPVRHQLPARSSANPTGDEGSELVIYSRRQGQRKHDELPKTSTSFEEKKNEEKATSVPLSSNLAGNAKDKGKAIAVPFDSLAAQKAKDQEKLVTVPIDSTPVENLRGKEKGISASFRPSNVETRDMEEDFYVPFTSTPVEKMRDKGKAVAVPVSCTLEEMEEKRRSTAMLINSEQKKKQREKRQADTMVQSCPPLLRTGKIENELNQVRDDTLSKYWTAPQGMEKKRKCPRKQSASKGSLSPEFVKKMKAYFEEVDAFELPIEEVSEHDLE